MTTQSAAATSPAPATGPTKQPENSRVKFRAIFPEILNELVADLEQNFDLNEETLTYLRSSIEYNVPHGKLNRGMAVRMCFAAFARTPTENDLFLADVLGWCIELLQGYFLVADDIMDRSQTRRGQVCWYKKPEIGLNAINDASMLEAMIFRVLKSKFRNHPAYMHLVELFLDITYTTQIGQLLDLSSPGPVGTSPQASLERFNDDMLARIYKYKTSHYSFFLPCALGMRLAGVEDEKCYKVAKDICLDLGYYFQAQDDFIDCFGDPEVTGKVGTDIEECTCTWLVVQALKKCTKEQKEILAVNYGLDDASKVQVVKNLYEELNLRDEFADFEAKSYADLQIKIGNVRDMPTDAFRFLLSKIYKRDK